MLPLVNNISLISTCSLKHSNQMPDQGDGKKNKKIQDAVLKYLVHQMVSFHDFILSTTHHSGVEMTYFQGLGKGLCSVVCIKT